MGLIKWISSLFGNTDTVEVKPDYSALRSEYVNRSVSQKSCCVPNKRSKSDDYYPSSSSSSPPDTSLFDNPITYVVAASVMSDTSTSHDSGSSSYSSDSSISSDCGGSSDSGGGGCSCD